MKTKILLLGLGLICTALPSMAQVDHELVFEKLPKDLFRSNVNYYVSSTAWYIGNYDMAKYSDTYRQNALYLTLKQNL